MSPRSTVCDNTETAREDLREIARDRSRDLFPEIWDEPGGHVIAREPQEHHVLGKNPPQENPAGLIVVAESLIGMGTILY